MADTKRLRYFDGQFMHQADFTDEQDYLLNLERDHERLLHTAGIAEGLVVSPAVNPQSAISITSGIAYDALGRRIVLGDNLTRDLIGITGNPLYVTIAYDETATDSQSGAGETDKTRYTEAPKLEILDSLVGVDVTLKLVLGTVNRTGTTVTSVDSTGRRSAGQKGGDLDVRGITVGNDAYPASSWVRIDLPAASRIEVHGNMTVDGNIGMGTSGGTVDGRDVSADGNRLDTHIANMSNPHGTTALQAGALPLTGGTLTGHVTTDDNTRRIRDGKVRELALVSYPPTITLQSTATSGTSWVDIAGMTVTVNLFAPTGVSQVPVFVRFSMAGVTISNTTGILSGTAEYQVLVDANTTPACYVREFHLANASNVFDIRTVTMERLLLVAPGTHTFKVQWSVRSADAQAGRPVTLNGCYSTNCSRELAIIEL